MRKNTMIALGLFLFFVSQAAWSAPDPKKWAVVVGVDEYQRTGVADLKYAVSDAKLFAEVLTEVVGVPQEQMFLYTTQATSSLEMPRLTNLVYRLEWLKDHVKPGDTLFFYFAGHGVETEGETFLLMDNADNRSKATLTMSTLQSKLLLDLLQQCQAQDTLVVLDACRNDPAAGRGTEDNPMTEAMSRGLVFQATGEQASGNRNLATLFACDVGERSYEWPEKGHGFFTYYLAEGLKSGAAGSGGAVTLGALSTYVRTQVAQASQQSGERQEPSLRYEGPGPERWVLAQNRAATTTTQGPAAIGPSQWRQLLEENARLKADNARLEAEITALKKRP